MPRITQFALLASLSLISACFVPAKDSGGQPLPVTTETSLSASTATSTSSTSRPSMGAAVGTSGTTGAASTTSTASAASTSTSTGGTTGAASTSASAASAASSTSAATQAAAASSGGTTGLANTTASASSSTGTSASSTGTSGAVGSCSTLLADFCTLAQACQQYDSNCATAMAGTSGILACAIAQAAECDATIQSAIAAQDCRLFIGGGAAGASTCTAAFNGAFTFVTSASEGEPCSTTADCISRPDGGNVTCTAWGVCPGVCTAGALAQPCGPVCTEGYCSTTGTCQPFLTAGASCTGNGGGECDPASTYCDNGVGGAGLCQPYLPEGSSCVNAYDACDPATDFCSFGSGTSTCQHRLSAGSPCIGIRSGGCEAGTFCIPVADAGLVCEPPAQLGQPCVEDCGWNNCLTGSCFAGICQGSTQANPQVGDACDASITPYCATGYCESVNGGSGICQPPPGLGQPCGPDSLCDAALSCVNGTCAGAPPAGEPCSTNFGLACRLQAMGMGASCWMGEATPAAMTPDTSRAANEKANMASPPGGKSG